MPVIVSAISRSSLYAGTTTATRLPSSMRPVRLQGRAAGEPARERLPQERGGDAEQEAEEGADDGGVPLAAGGRLQAGVARDALLRRGGQDDLPNGGGVRLHARQDPAADRERRPQADDGLRL